MTTVLITGCRGQLGQELAAQLGMDPEYRLVLYDIEEMDITDAPDVFEKVRAIAPDVVINCAAYTAVDACEDNVDLAYRVNALGARNLAAVTHNIGARILHISTNYVFGGDGMRDSDGAVRAYVENDPTVPINVYGKSKLAGEQLVRVHNPRHVIFRTAWLYGGEGRNFVTNMLHRAADGEVIRAINDLWGNPTSARELSKLIIDIMERPESGIFHASCEGVCTWYEFALEIFRIKGVQANVVPCSADKYPRPARRPRYAMLDNRAARLIGAYAMAHWKDALADYLK